MGPGWARVIKGEATLSQFVFKGGQGSVKGRSRAVKGRSRVGQGRSRAVKGGPG